MVKRGFFCFLSIFLCILLAACSVDVQDQTPTQAEPTQDLEQNAEGQGLALPLTDSDSLNPYTAVSMTNLTLMPLLYDGLVKINPDYGLDYVIAQNIENNGTTVRITLKDNIVFSDGSPLTAKDVVYSLNAARAGGYYAARLSNIAEISGKGLDVVISLKSPDSLFPYCLDVPIVKEKSADGTYSAIGSGRYVLDMSSNDYQLRYNTAHVGGGQPRYDVITLAVMPSLETTEYSLKTGKVSLCYRGSSEDTMGGTGAITMSCPMPQLMYIGLNGNTGITANASVRQAISAALDRDEIVDRALTGNGRSVQTPYYPGIHDEDSQDSYRSDLEKANALLDQAGLTDKDQFGMRRLNGQMVTIELMVPSSSSYKLLVANEIVDMLKLCGIKVNIVQVDDKTYSSRIASGNYQMYVGEILLNPNMDLSPFFTGAASPGLFQSPALNNAYSQLLVSQDNYDDFITAFVAAMPFVPICYRDAVIVKNQDLNCNIVPSASDCFYNIDQW